MTNRFRWNTTMAASQNIRHQVRSTIHLQPMGWVLGLASTTIIESPASKRFSCLNNIPIMVPDVLIHLLVLRLGLIEAEKAETAADGSAVYWGSIQNNDVDIFSFLGVLALIYMASGSGPSVASTTANG